QLTRALVGRFRAEDRAYHGMVGPEVLAHALERERQAHLFELGIDGRFGLEAVTESRQAGVGVFAQPLGVRLLAFIRSPHERAGVREELAVESGAAVEPGVRDQNLAVAPLRLRDVVPGASRLRAQ